jgi:hypothetical protein
MDYFSSFLGVSSLSGSGNALICGLMMAWLWPNHQSYRSDQTCLNGMSGTLMYLGCCLGRPWSQRRLSSCLCMPQRETVVNLAVQPTWQRLERFGSLRTRAREMSLTSINGFPFPGLLLIVIFPCFPWLVLVSSSRIGFACGNVLSGTERICMLE